MRIREKNKDFPNYYQLYTRPIYAGGGYYRVVGPVVLPLVVPVGPTDQRALQHVNVGAGAGVVAPPARLPRARARGGSADTSRGGVTLT